ncbi:alpha/beta fold hydrolase [Nitratireductor sp. GCM10026969]|uniref:alpha/beta fold hydrolase n=1 Tax=Nitratireductor sp. GCM10026969 TaxID=3252645 RepID=UPI0036228221
MSARVIRTGDVEIATESFGDRSHPPILLIMGAMASMLWWPEGFCRKLAARGRYVIRYDHRDTGLSTAYEPGNPPYSFDDMADDALRVLDGYGIGRAHIVGMSMGGMTGQMVALAHSDRVATLTAISTSPIGTDTSSLPPMSEAYQEHAAAGEAVDWTNEAEVIDFIVKDTRMIAGTAHPYDEVAARNLIERDVARARSFVSATNHFMLKGGDGWKGKLNELVPPLLVIHGTADPLFPVEHGTALAAEVDGARLVRIEGGGHELHPADWNQILSAIAEHTCV